MFDGCRVEQSLKDTSASCRREKSSRVNGIARPDHLYLSLRIESPDKHPDVATLEVTRVLHCYFITDLISPTTATLEGIRVAQLRPKAWSSGSQNIINGVASLNPTSVILRVTNDVDRQEKCNKVAE